MKTYQKQMKLIENNKLLKRKENALKQQLKTNENLMKSNANV